MWMVYLHGDRVAEHRGLSVGLKGLGCSVMGLRRHGEGVNWDVEW